MIFIGLLALKILIYMGTVGIKNNRIYVFGLSSLFILLIFSWIYSSRFKKKDRKAFLAYGILSLILFIDLLHFSYFNVLPSVKMLDQVHQVGAVGDSLLEIFNLKNLLMVLDLPFLAYWIYRKRKLSGKEETRLSRKFSLVLVLLILASLVGLNKAGKLESVARQEVFSYHFTDIKNSLKGESQALALDQDQEGRLDEKLAELRARTGKKDGDYRGLAKDRNLIVIQVESLQNFVIGLEHKGQEVTPNLNKLVADKSSFYFDNYYQMTGMGNTSDAEFVTNNSLYPSPEGPSYTRYEDRDFYSLPILLEDHGYKSWVFHGYKKEFWNRERAYVKQGFDRFFSEEDYKFKEEDKIGMGINDHDFFKQSIELLKKERKDDQPFYSFLISLTNHIPFKLDKSQAELELEPDFKDKLVGNYLQSVHYTDQALGYFIEELKKEGLYENSVIAIYGDHIGVPVGDQEVQKNMKTILGKDYGREEGLKIPLIIHLPGRTEGKTVSDLGSQLDFYPTISNLMGLDNDKGLVFGRDLLNLEETNRLALSNYVPRGSFIYGDKIFILPIDGSFENSQAYNKDTGEPLDPKEYEEIYRELIFEMNMSNTIMQNNLMKEIADKKSLKIEKDLMELPREIKRTEASFKEMDKAISQGYQGLELSFSYDPDQEKVMLGDIDMEALDVWLKDKPQLKILARIEEGQDAKEVFTALGDFERWRKEQQITQKLYPVIDRLEDYEELNKFGFKLVLNIDQVDLDSKDFKSLEARYPQDRLFSEKSQPDQKLIKELIEKEKILILDSNYQGEEDNIKIIEP